MRGIGFQGLATALDWSVMWLPFVSIAALLCVGFCITMEEDGRESHALMVRLPIVFLVALVPLAFHLTMVKVGYAVDPQSPGLLAPGSVSQRIALAFGLVLIGIGVGLVNRSRHASVPRR